MSGRQSYRIFETALGWVGIAWTDSAITRLFMPDSTYAAIERRMMRFDPNAENAGSGRMPAFVASAIAQLHAYIGGEAVDFSSTPVSVGNVGAMRQAIYAALRQVGHGETVTYGELAKRTGYNGMAREIGEAMGKNPVPIIVPCHRVVAAGGKLGGFSAPGGAHTKEKLLALECADVQMRKPAQSAFSF